MNNETQTLKPRKFFNMTGREILVNGTWHTLGTVSLIGSRDWTIRNEKDEVICRCSGNTEFQIR
jgi:hypothetical protein